MSEAERLDGETLVAVHQARDEWEGTLLVGLLRDNGVAAALRRPSAMPPLDAAERLTGYDKACSISVLEHDAGRARDLIANFLAAATDDQVLAEEAAEKCQVDKDTIHRLRGELREERQTFAFLEWLGMVLLGAAALLWIIWPPWLKALAPLPGLRWVMLVALAAAAGLWARSKL